MRTEGHARPLATYRVQLSREFGFASAALLAEYLSRLGISDMYVSPSLEAAEGSTHGYDVIDHSRVSRPLGGQQAHDALCDALSSHGLGHVLDIVPNHMAITGGRNAWWWDVLENGLASRFAGHFDVDWHSPEPRLRGRLLTPVLADRYGRELSGGRITIAREGTSFTVRCGDQCFSPASPESVALLLHAAADDRRSEALAFVARALARLVDEMDPESAGVRHEDKVVLYALLASILDDAPALAEAVDRAVAAVNGDPARMDAFLNRQNYRLAFWGVAGSALNYRRFFNINTLVGLRVEDERVFDDTHRLILDWVRRGRVTGLRIDHIDGLREPEEYLHRLLAAAPDAWIIVEKILDPREHIPESWPVSGTTGYDFMNEVGGLFVDPAAEEEMTRVYRDFTGEEMTYGELLRHKKHMMLYQSFTGESDRLTDMLVKISQRHAAYRDYSRQEINEALREFLACMPVYRSYVHPAARRVSGDDRRYIETALERAERHRPELEPELWHFLRRLFFLEITGDIESDFVLRAQQLSSPAMVKGSEDTGYYVYNRLISLNEVGGDPERFGVSVEDFHEFCHEAQRSRPLSMLSTSTHDTKHGEDARLRISLLSEIPGRWATAVARWSILAERHRRGGFPDRNAEYRLYQTLVAAWPLDFDRLWQCALKSAREAKVHTSWSDIRSEYEDALRAFVAGILDDEAFRADFEAFLEPLIEPARVSSLAQTLLRCTAPGVPDLYQGAELWYLTLVDPDNRRLVDFEARMHLLAALEKARAEDALARMEEGAPKMLVIARALSLRRRHRDIFGPRGGYEPLRAAGEKADHVVAFVRGGCAATVAPRLVIGLDGRWGDTRIALPEGRWKDEFTGLDLRGEVLLSDLLAHFPVALLLRQEATP